MPSLILKPGRERSLQRCHPWVFSGAVAEVQGDPAPGATVEILSAAGAFLARGAWSPHSQIRARAWTFDPAEAVDDAFLRRRIAAALDMRRRLHLEDESNALRLIHAESDALPGLIVDRYADLLAVQFLSAGAEAWRETILDALQEQLSPQAVFERSDVDVRSLEGLPQRSGQVRGAPSSPLVTIHEHGLEFEVDLAGGHKTGFYIDQRPNRLAVRRLAQGREVLDCFCYTGGFSLNALQGGAASVLSVDASADALDACRSNAGRHPGFSARHDTLEGDVFQVLRKFRDEGRAFDMVVLDPPKFAPTAAQAEKAARGYKDINLLAFKLLRPGGLLVTFSCSGGVDAALFQKIVAAAALDAGVQAQIVTWLAQGADHPVGLSFPEGAYLKGLVCIKI